MSEYSITAQFTGYESRTDQYLIDFDIPAMEEGKIPRDKVEKEFKIALVHESGYKTEFFSVFKKVRHKKIEDGAKISFLVPFSECHKVPFDMTDMIFQLFFIKGA